MSSQVGTMLVVLLVIAVAAFGSGLWSLGVGDDVLAVVLFVLGATSLRGVAQTVRLLERRFS